VVGSGILGAVLNTVPIVLATLHERGCVTWSYGSQKEPGGRRTERCQQQNGHDGVP